MYSVKLHICLTQDVKNKLEQYGKIPPKPRFEHKFELIKSACDIPVPIPDEHQYLIIASQDCEINLTELKKRIGENGFLAIYAKDTAKITSEQKEAADEIWPQAANLDDFYFEKALNLIAERKEAWLQKAWLETIINSSPDTIWFKDADGLYIDVKEFLNGHNAYCAQNTSKTAYGRSDHAAANKTSLLSEDIVKADGKLNKLKTYKTPIFDGMTIIGTIASLAT